MGIAPGGGPCGGGAAIAIRYPGGYDKEDGAGRFVESCTIVGDGKPIKENLSERRTTAKLSSGPLRCIIRWHLESHWRCQLDR